MATKVLAFGRFNPPSIGHEKLVKKLLEVHKESHAESVSLYLSHSQDSKRNPLDYDTKIKFAKTAFGDKLVEKTTDNTIIKILKTVEKNGFVNIIYIAGGADNVSEFKKLINKFNGKSYNFKSIKIVSAGDRDPDDASLKGISATKMRQAAADGDFDSFNKMLPVKLKNNKEIFKKVQRGLKIKMTEDNIITELLSIQARRKLSINAKKAGNIRKKLISKKRNEKKVLTTDKAAKRAKAQVIRKFKAKFGAGPGASIGAKVRAEKKIKKLSSKIDRLAKRSIKSVKKADREKKAAKRSKANESVLNEASVIGLVAKVLGSDTARKMTKQVNLINDLNYRTIGAVNNLKKLSISLLPEIKEEGFMSDSDVSKIQKATDEMIKKMSEVSKIVEGYHNMTLDTEFEGVEAANASSEY